MKVIRHFFRSSDRWWERSRTFLLWTVYLLTTRLGGIKQATVPTSGGLWREAGGVRPHVEETSHVARMFTWTWTTDVAGSRPYLCRWGTKITSCWKICCWCVTKRPLDEGTVSLNTTEVLMLNTSLRVTRDINSFFINRLSVSVILQSFSESQVPAGKQCGVLARDLTWTGKEFVLHPPLSPP
jgi:hypothetical protein